MHEAQRNICRTQGWQRYLVMLDVPAFSVGGPRRPDQQEPKEIARRHLNWVISREFDRYPKVQLAVDYDSLTVAGPNVFVWMDEATAAKAFQPRSSGILSVVAHPESIESLRIQTNTHAASLGPARDAHRSQANMAVLHTEAAAAKAAPERGGLEL